MGIGNGKTDVLTTEPRWHPRTTNKKMHGYWLSINTNIVPQAAYADSAALCVRQDRRSASAAAQARTHGLWPATIQSYVAAMDAI